MYGIEMIRALNRKAAGKVRSEGIRESLTPITEETLEEVRRSKHIGDAAKQVDRQFKRLGTFFVDTSGLGRPDEPALAYSQLLEELKELCQIHGEIQTGIIEFGQFQAYLGAWSIQRKGARK